MGLGGSDRRRNSVNMATGGGTVKQINSNQTMTVTTTEPTVAQPASLLPIVSAPEKKPIIENNDKKRIAKAVELLLIAPCLKVPQAMRAARFTDSESVGAGRK